MEQAGDFLGACHGGLWFVVSVGTVGHSDGGRRELCLMLCPDRDTLLDVSARYL